MHTTQYKFAKPYLPNSQIADIVKNAVSVAVAPFHEGNAFRPDLVTMTNCVSFGVHNGDGTYKPDDVIEGTFHINYGIKTIGDLVVGNQVALGFYGTAPLSNFETVRSNGNFKTIPKDRAAIEQAIIKELAARGLIQVNDTDSEPLPP